MIRDLFFTLLFFVLIGTLSAQHRDTVYVERETMTYDTVTVYDTVRVHDTLNIADYLRSEEFEPTTSAAKSSSGSSTVRNMLTICRLRTL